MNKNLLSILINKKVIQNGTEIGIVRKGFGIDGRPVTTNNVLVSSYKSNDCRQSAANHIVEIFKIDVEGDNITLHGHSTIDGHCFKILPDSIHVIDGMTPESIAKVYGLFEDGTPRRLGKKRGRKTNSEKLLNDQNNRLSSDSGCHA